MFQKGGGMEAAMLSLGGAYKCEDWEASTRLGLHAWHLTYLHKLKDLSLVAECEGSLMQVRRGGEGREQSRTQTLMCAHLKEGLETLEQFLGCAESACSENE